jgi:hypothetical protein
VQKYKYWLCFFGGAILIFRDFFFAILIFFSCVQGSLASRSSCAKSAPRASPQVLILLALLVQRKSVGKKKVREERAARLSSGTQFTTHAQHEYSHFLYQ